MTTASPDWRGYEYVIIDWRMTRCGVVYRVVGLKSITGSACVNDSLICVGVDGDCDSGGLEQERALCDGESEEGYA